VAKQRSGEPLLARFAARVARHAPAWIDFNLTTRACRLTATPARWGVGCQLARWPPRDLSDYLGRRCNAVGFRDSAGAARAGEVTSL